LKVGKESKNKNKLEEKAMRRILFLLGVVLTAVLTASGQTIPTAQNLPYSQNFDGLPHSSSTYPPGWQGWHLGTNPGGSTDFSTAQPLSDTTLRAYSNASTTSGGVHNYNGKIGFLPTGSTNPALCLVINTSGFRRIIMTYDIMTIRNPYDGSSNTRINKAALQYRASEDLGTFTTTSDSNYQNITTAQTSGTDPQNLETHTILLPSACDDKPVVQLRWVARQVSGFGSRPSFAVDNIYINGTRFFTTSGTISGGPFYGLELDGSNITVSLTGNLEVDTLSFLQDGKVLTGNYFLKVNKTISGAGAGKFVDGNLVLPVSSTGSKKWETGQGNDYLPLTINFTSLTGSGDVTVTVLDRTSTPPGGPIGANKVLKRYFRVTQSGGITSFNADLTLTYTDADVSEQDITNENSLRVFQWDGAQWKELTVIDRDVNNNTITVTGVTSFSDFVISGTGDAPLPVQVASVLADVRGRDVRIKIKTQTERDDFLGFNVYRNKDGENFVIVGSYESVSSLRAKGNLAYGGEYEFVDKGLNSGRYQYKIEAVSRSEKKFVGDVISVEVEVPKGYALHQNYPNPFNPVTVIEFEIPEAGYVLIELYNSVGQKVRGIFAGDLPAGYHKVRFDASGLSSGVYFYRMSAGKFNAVRKMVIMK
jgi:hypothetical protein